MIRSHVLLWSLVALSSGVPIAGGDDGGAAHVPLFFREDWKEIPAETPVTQQHVANPELVLSLHGPAKMFVKKSHHDNIPNDPFYIWSGECRSGNWGISLSRKNSLVDLSGDAHVHFRTMQSGAHVLKFILELSDGKWLVSQQGFGETPDWHDYDQPISKLNWQELNIDTITAGEKVKKPDLSKIRSIGWTDLLSGQGSDNSSRIDWIEVYGKPAAQ